MAEIEFEMNEASTAFGDMREGDSKTSKDITLTITRGQTGNCGALTFFSASGNFTYEPGKISCIQISAMFGPQSSNIGPGWTRADGQFEWLGQAQTVQFSDLSADNVGRMTFEVAKCSVITVNAKEGWYKQGDTIPTAISGTCNSSTISVKENYSGKSCTISGTGTGKTWTYDVGTLSDGVHYYQFVGKGEKGVPQSTMYGTNIYIDTKSAEIAFIGTAVTAGYKDASDVYWYAKRAKASLIATASDKTSGVASFTKNGTAIGKPYMDTADLDTSAGTENPVEISFEATDVAGNDATTKVFKYGVDDYKPTLTGEGFTGGVDVEGKRWYHWNETGSYAVGANDVGSGVKTVKIGETDGSMNQEKYTFSLDTTSAESYDGITKTITATDQVGNVGTLNFTYYVDCTAPEMENGKFSDNAVKIGDVTWFKKGDSATYSVDVTDAGSGVNFVTMDSVSGTKGGDKTYTFSLDASIENVSGIGKTICSLDKVGNEEQQGISYKVDGTAPVMTADGDLKKYAETVTLSLVSSDSGSGVKKVQVKVGENGEYADYTEDEYIVKNNGVYYFKAIDNVGYETETSVTVSNIAYQRGFDLEKDANHYFGSNLKTEKPEDEYHWEKLHLISNDPEQETGDYYFKTMLVDLQGPESDYPGNASIEFGSLDSDRNPESTAYAHVTNTSGDYKADLTVTDISLYSGSGITVDSDATIAFSGTISTSKNGEMGMIPLYGTRTVTVDDEQVDYDYYYTFLNDGLRINIMEEGASSDSAYSKDQTYKILDYTGAGSLANEYYQNCISNWVELLENGYKLTQYNSDLYINLGDQRTLYVNTAWDGAEHGDIVVLDGKNLVYGYNAFSTVDAAFNNAADRTREIILASDAAFTSDGPVALKNNISVSSYGEGKYSIDWNWTSDANGYFKSNKETAERTVTFASSVIVKEADASKMFGFYDNGNVTLKGEANLNGVKLSGADMQIAETGALNLDKDAKVYLSDGANLTVKGNVSDISSESAAAQIKNGFIGMYDASNVSVKFTKAFVDLEKIGAAGSPDSVKEITFDGAIGKVKNITLFSSKNSLTVKDSRLDVSGDFMFGTETSFLITGTSIVNADVDGAASLNGTLKDSILTVNGLELTGDSALQNTELTIDASTFSVAKNLTIDKDSALIVSGGSITNSANITVTVSADNSCTDAVITVADAFTAAEDANKLSVNVQNLSSDLGVYMVVDADAQSLYNAEITGNGENNYRLKTIGNDLYVTNVSLDVLAVNNAWSMKSIGEKVTATVNGAEMTFFYGVNAFSTIKAAAEVLNSVTEQTADPEKVSKIAVAGSADAYGENVTITNDVTLTTTSDSAEKVKLNSYTITVTAGTATFDASADFSNTGDNVKVSGADAEVLMKAGSKVDKLTVADNANASVGEAEATVQAELTGFVNEGGTLTINNAAVGASSAAGGETNVSGSTFNGDISINGGTFTDDGSTFSSTISVGANGTMNLTGSEILTDSTITGKSITNSGKLSLEDVEVGYDGTDLAITNSGTLELDGNNTVIVKTISGAMDVKGGTLTFAKSGTYQDGKLTVADGATLSLEKGFVIGDDNSSNGTSEFALGGTVKLNAMNQIVVKSDGTWNDANAAVKIGTDGYDSSVNGAVKVIDRTGGTAYVMDNYEVSGSGYGLVEYNYDLWITDADKTDKKVIYVNCVGGSGAGDQEYGYIFGYNAVKGVSDLSNVYSAAGDDTEKFLFNGGTYQIGTASESIRSYDLALYGNAAVTFSGTYEGQASSGSSLDIEGSQGSSLSVETVKLNAIDGTQINAASDVNFTIGTFDLLTNGTNIQSNNSTVTIASGVDGVTAWNVDGSTYTLGTWAGGAGNDDFKVTYDEDKDVIKVQRLALDAKVTGTVADNDRWKFMGAAKKVSGEYFVDSQIKGILTIQADSTQNTYVFGGNYIDMDGANYSTRYAGSKIVLNGKFAKNGIFGGDRIEASGVYSHATGNHSIVLDSSVEGLTAQQVYGGSRIGGTENTAAYDGNIYINAVSGTYGKIYGGGFVAGEDCLELRDGTNYISISGATVTGKVTGGTHVGKNGKQSVTFTDITISNGSKVGSIIGGHGATSFDDTYSSIVTGTTTITVNGLNGDVVTGDIFAGSAGYGRVIGGTLVKLQSLDVNDSIGKISGDSSRGNDAQSYVLGSRALVVTESKTTVGQLSFFDTVSMTDSDLTVSGAGDLSAVSVWEMDNSTLTFLDGADLDFTDDELIADHIDFTNGKVTLFSAEDEITGFSDFAKVSLNENLLEYNSEANVWSFGAGVHTIRIELSDDRKSILASGIAIA